MEMNLIRELNGYRVIYNPTHPRAMKTRCWDGYMYEHILIAEERIGRYLNEDEIVHHLNGLRGDNRYCNLLVLSASQHGRLHAWLSAGAPGIERFRENGKNSLNAKDIPPSFCLVCGKTLQDKQINACSVSCYGLLNRKVERPKKKQLLEDVNTMSMVKVGIKYGVSDNAVRKWLKLYGISKSIMSRAFSELEEGAETSGEVLSS